MRPNPSRSDPLHNHQWSHLPKETSGKDSAAIWIALRSLRLLIVPLFLALVCTAAFTNVARAEEWPDWEKIDDNTAEFTFQNGTTGTLSLEITDCSINTIIEEAVEQSHDVIIDFPSTWYTPTPPDPTEFISVSAARTCVLDEVVGRLTITFSQPVDNPTFHFFNLFTVKYRFPEDMSITRLSGNNAFDVNGNSVNDTDELLQTNGCGVNASPPEACGSVRVNGRHEQLQIDIVISNLVLESVDNHSFTISLATPFPHCDARAFLFQDQTNTNGYAVNLVTGNYVLVFPEMENYTNAIGFNQMDNFIWGKCAAGCGEGEPNNYLTRVDADGGNADFPIAALPAAYFNIGDVRPDGLYFLTYQYTDTFYIIDLNPTSPTYLTILDTKNFSGSFDGDPTPGIQLNIADWAFHPSDGQLYTVYQEVDPIDNNVHQGRLLRIDPDTGAVTDLGLLRDEPDTVIDFGPDSGGWGAMYFDSTGNLYISNNGTGLIHRVDITAPETPPDQYHATLLTGGPSSTHNDGARCNNAPPPLDYGDAPDSYGTIFSTDGARHDSKAIPDILLGTTVDHEMEGAASASADGDDNADFDDEDAFGALPPMATSQSSYSLTVPVSNTSGANATLVGWIDWNQNNNFDPDEGVASVVANNATQATLTWDNVSGLTGGTTYARLRIASEGEIDVDKPIGYAGSGEVEDYPFQLAVPPDDYFRLCPVSAEPPTTDFSIAERWSTTGTMVPTYQTPLVGDLNGDGAPEVVIGANTNLSIGGSPAAARLAEDIHIFRGNDGTLVRTIDTPQYSWSGNAAYAIADVDNDGQGEIILKVAGHTVALGDQGRLIAYNSEDGTELWTSNQRYDYGTSRGGFAINLADFNADGLPEVYVGNQIFNALTGVRLVAATSDTDSTGCPGRNGTHCFWGNSAAVDMDSDGILELVAGNVVYKVDIQNTGGEAGNSLSVWRQAATQTDVGDGWTAVADIDLDGDPDVIVVRQHNGLDAGNAVLYVWDGQTDTVMGITPQLVPRGSQPFIGDIDGDGQPEIVFVAENKLYAYDYVDGVGLQEKWNLDTIDGSGVTTLTVFDFNNDGVMELVYRDEANIRILNGSGNSATDLASFVCTSGTGTEMPVVADLDGSGMAQILVTCADTENTEGDVRAFTTASFDWANARPVWNQQAYFVTHVNDNLTIPSDQFPHWTTFSDEGQVCSLGVNRPLNAFLQQVGDLDLTTGCPVVCENADFGDAPVSYGTLLADDGARHSRNVNSSLMLGTAADTESDGQAGDNADGDDLNGTVPDDEDGVAFDAVLTPGEFIQLPVQVSGTGGRLFAWFDWNQNGNFTDPGEVAVNNLVVNSGSNNVTINVPANAAVGTTYARFRLTTQTTLGPTGVAIDGEVEDYTVTIGEPELSITKRDELVNDADNSGTASPGDTIRYTILINNTGVGTALNATYTDTPDPNTKIVEGSVKTSKGTVTTGNGEDDTSIAVAIGDIPSGVLVTIQYDVIINAPVPEGVTQVENQGIITTDNPNIPDKPTDDPDDPTPDDPTETPIDAKPRIEAYKRDSLLIDADNSGSPSPGDTLLYTVTLINSGNQAATGLVYHDNPDPHTTLVVGSVDSNVGTVVQGNTDGDTAIRVEIGTLAGGGAVVNISYHATINSPLPANVSEVSNQGIVTSDDPDMPDTPTDDPDDPEKDDPTDTVVVASPLIDVYKEGSLLVDADGNGSPSPGDTLVYFITIFNYGNQDASDVTYSDTPDANTALIVGSVSSNRGTITSGNSDGNSTVQVNVGTLPAGATANINYRVTINNTLPPDVVQVVNQGITRGGNFEDVPSDDPSTPGLPKDPTKITVVAAPVLVADKTDLLLIDADENGLVSPGDTLVYYISVANHGNTAATGVVYNDTPDANTTLVPGSVHSNLGTVTSGSAPGDTTVSVDVGQIPAGGELRVSYQVVINLDLPDSVREIRNQGIVNNDNDIMPCPEEDGRASGIDAVHCPAIPTDDPSTASQNDPTITIINRDPTAEEPTEQPTERGSIFLPQINRKSVQ